jgi:hypothetical protein
MFVFARRRALTIVRVATAIDLLTGAGASATVAQDGSWNSTATAGGSRGDSTNWVGGVIASGAGNTATFGLNFGSGASVTLDGDRTIGTVFTSSANPWSLDPGTGGGLTVAGFNITGAGPLSVSAALAGANFAKDGSGTIALRAFGKNDTFGTIAAH